MVYWSNDLHLSVWWPRNSGIAIGLKLNMHVACLRCWCSSTALDILLFYMLYHKTIHANCFWIHSFEFRLNSQTASKDLVIRDSMHVEQGSFIKPNLISWLKITLDKSSIFNFLVLKSDLVFNLVAWKIPFAFLRKQNFFLPKFKWIYFIYFKKKQHRQINWSFSVSFFFILFLCQFGSLKIICVVALAQHVIHQNVNACHIMDLDSRHKGTLS